MHTHGNAETLHGSRLATLHYFSALCGSQRPVAALRRPGLRVRPGLQVCGCRAGVVAVCRVPSSPSPGASSPSSPAVTALFTVGHAVSVQRRVVVAGRGAVARRATGRPSAPAVGRCFRRRQPTRPLWSSRLSRRHQLRAAWCPARTSVISIVSFM